MTKIVPAAAQTQIVGSEGLKKDSGREDVRLWETGVPESE
jgi:hypothetical protein